MGGGGGGEGRGVVWMVSMLQSDVLKRWMVDERDQGLAYRQFRKKEWVGGVGALGNFFDTWTLERTELAGRSRMAGQQLFVSQK